MLVAPSSFSSFVIDSRAERSREGRIDGNLRVIGVITSRSLFHSEKIRLNTAASAIHRFDNIAH